MTTIINKWGRVYRDVRFVWVQKREGIALFEGYDVMGLDMSTGKAQIFCVDWGKFPEDANAYCQRLMKEMGDHPDRTIDCQKFGLKKFGEAKNEGKLP